MNFFIPFILTFLSFASYSYLISTYSFLHNDLTQRFQISKLEFGIIYGVSNIGIIIGTLLFLGYTSKIHKNMVTYYVWGCLGYVLPYLLLVLTSIVYQHPSKILLYLIMFCVGFFRCFQFPCLLMMIKAHKEIASKSQVIHQNNYKLLVNIWSASFDFGVVIGFFLSNWMYYTLGYRWEYLIIIGSVFFITTTIFLLFGLQSYLQNKEPQNQLEIRKEGSSSTEYHETSISNFVYLVNKNMESKLFLLNATIMDSLHMQFCLVLPAFFFDSGYKGGEGYLLALYSLFIVFGTWLFGVLDYVFHKIKLKKLQQEQKAKGSNLIVNEHTKPQDSLFAFPYIYSVSIFLFVLVLTLLAIISFRSDPNSNQQSMSLEMILMCFFGLFFGGPVKSYFSHRTIRAMGNLEEKYRQQKLKNASFDEKSSKQSLGFFETHKIQIGSALITINRLLVHLLTIAMYIVSFYLIQHFLPYLLVFLIIIGVFALIFDIWQNVVIVKNHENQLKRRQNQTQQNYTQVKEEEQQVIMYQD